jgi:hypothetical protein
VTWPGSQLPAGTKPPRRRGKARRRGTSASERWVATEARKAGVAPRPKITDGGTTPLCPEHVIPLLEALGFTSLAAFIDYVDVLSRRGPKQAKTVRIPRPKFEGLPDVLRISAVLCPSCGGRVSMCATCSGWSWGVRITRRKAGSP